MEIIPVKTGRAYEVTVGHGCADAFYDLSLIHILTRVLRLGPGDAVTLCDGAGFRGV